MITDDEYFCDNPRCVLNVRLSSPRVRGRGEWARLANGRIYARTRIGNRHFCHVCARDPEAAPGVQLDPQELPPA